MQTRVLIGLLTMLCCLALPDLAACQGGGRGKGGGGGGGGRPACAPRPQPKVKCQQQGGGRHQAQGPKPQAHHDDRGQHCDKTGGNKSENKPQAQHGGNKPHSSSANHSNQGNGSTTQHGNNGVGNGDDPQPKGDPKVNDGAGTGPGSPGAKAGNGRGKK